MAGAPSSLIMHGDHFLSCQSQKSKIHLSQTPLQLGVQMLLVFSSLPAHDHMHGIRIESSQGRARLLGCIPQAGVDQGRGGLHQQGSLPASTGGSQVSTSLTVVGAAASSGPHSGMQSRHCQRPTGSSSTNGSHKGLITCSLQGIKGCDIIPQSPWCKYSPNG